MNRNTKLFHSIVKGRKKTLFEENAKQPGYSNIVEEEVATEAMDFCHRQFTQERHAASFPLLNHILDPKSADEDSYNQN